jgi:hypothetical protein
VKKLVLLVASLAILLATTATLTLAQTEPVAEVRCLAPEGGCGPDTTEDDELLCLIPEGCDTNNDGMPDLRAGDLAPGGETRTSVVQYDTTL